MYDITAVTTHAIENVTILLRNGHLIPITKNDYCSLTAGLDIVNCGDKDIATLVNTLFGE